MSNRRFVELVRQETGARCERWAYGLEAVAKAGGVSEGEARRAVKSRALDPGDLGSVARWIVARMLGHGVGLVEVERVAAEAGKPMSKGRMAYEGRARGAPWKTIGGNAAQQIARKYQRTHGLPWPPAMPQDTTPAPALEHP